MNKDEIIKEAEILCKKFINKVETGRARSRETYMECKHLLKHIKELEESTNRTQPTCVITECPLWGKCGCDEYNIPCYKLIK